MVRYVESPQDLFADWFTEANIHEPSLPNAMALGTVSPSGFPEVRIVLLKKYSENGFIFFTNYNSPKAESLRNWPYASLCFHWKSLKKQVRVFGQVTKISEEESDEYFSTRSLMSQIGVWASSQSETMKFDHELEMNVAGYLLKFAIGGVPRPPQWGGFRVEPVRFEFSEERDFRLPDRFVYTKEVGGWQINKIFP
jgi:pyridoxamine 5'-phosphate oxidase